MMYDRAIGLHGVSIPCPPWCKPAVSVAPPPPRRVLHHSAAKQIAVICAMPDPGVVTARDMADAIGGTRDGVSSIMAQLARKGLVWSTRDNKNTRAVGYCYRLTPEGRHEATAWRQG